MVQQCHPYVKFFTGEEPPAQPKPLPLTYAHDIASKEVVDKLRQCGPMDGRLSGRAKKKMAIRNDAISSSSSSNMMHGLPGGEEKEAQKDDESNEEEGNASDDDGEEKREVSTEVAENKEEALEPESESQSNMSLGICLSAPIEPCATAIGENTSPTPKTLSEPAPEKSYFEQAREEEKRKEAERVKREKEIAAVEGVGEGAAPVVVKKKRGRPRKIKNTPPEANSNNFNNNRSSGSVSAGAAGATAAGGEGGEVKKRKRGRRSNAELLEEQRRQFEMMGNMEEVQSDGRKRKRANDSGSGSSGGGGAKVSTDGDSSPQKREKDSASAITGEGAWVDSASKQKLIEQAMKKKKSYPGKKRGRKPKALLELLAAEKKEDRLARLRKERQMKKKQKEEGGGEIGEGMVYTTTEKKTSRGRRKVVKATVQTGFKNPRGRPPKNGRKKTLIIAAYDAQGTSSEEGSDNDLLSNGESDSDSDSSASASDGDTSTSALSSMSEGDEDEYMRFVEERMSLDKEGKCRGESEDPKLRHEAEAVLGFMKQSSTSWSRDSTPAPSPHLKRESEPGPHMSISGAGQGSLTPVFPLHLSSSSARAGIYAGGTHPSASAGNSSSHINTGALSSSAPSYPYQHSPAVVPQSASAASPYLRAQGYSLSSNSHSLSASNGNGSARMSDISVRMMQSPLPGGATQGAGSATGTPVQHSHSQSACQVVSFDGISPTLSLANPGDLRSPHLRTIDGTPLSSPRSLSFNAGELASANALSSLSLLAAISSTSTTPTASPPFSSTPSTPSSASAASSTLHPPLAVVAPVPSSDTPISTSQTMKSRSAPKPSSSSSSSSFAPSRASVSPPTSRSVSSSSPLSPSTSSSLPEHHFNPK